MFFSLVFLLLFSNLFTVVCSVMSCACEAERLSFVMNCNDTDTIVAALNMLQSPSCQTACSSDSSLCEKSFYIVQMHEDFCPDLEVPTDDANGFSYQSALFRCDACFMLETAPICPTPTCDDGSDSSVYDALLDAGCMKDCSSEACKTDFTTLSSVRQGCPGRSLNEGMEDKYISLSQSCDMHTCITAETAESILACESSNTRGSAVTAAIIFVVIMVVL